MLIVETIARIRREHFIKGKTIKEIARDLKVFRNTIRKVLRSGETSFEYERVVQPRPNCSRSLLTRTLPKPTRPSQQAGRPLLRAFLARGSLRFPVSARRY